MNNNPHNILSVVKDKGVLEEIGRINSLCKIIEDALKDYRRKLERYKIYNKKDL